MQRMYSTLSGMYSIAKHAYDKPELIPSLIQDVKAGPNIDSKTLIEKIKNSTSPVVEHDFGLALGSMYFIKPDPDIDFDNLVATILKQENPQRTRAAQAYMAGGPLLTSRSGEDALRHHYLFRHALSDSKKFTDLTMQALDDLELEDGATLTLRKLTTHSIYNLISNALFDVDISDELLTAFQKFTNILTGENTADKAEDAENIDVPVTNQMSDFAKNMWTILRGTYYANKLSGIPQFKDARETYIDASKKFIESQRQTIKDNIEHYANGNDITNMLALTVIELFKENTKNLKIPRDLLNYYLLSMLYEDDQSTFNTLLSDEYLHTVPVNIMAALNLRGVIPSMLHALATDPKLLLELRAYLADANLTDDMSNIYNVIQSDRDNNGVLNQIYLEGLRLRSFNEPLEELQFSTLFRYYLSQPITVANTTIPAGSVVCLLHGPRFVDSNIWGAQPEKFNSNRFFGTKDELNKDPKSKIPMAAFSHAPRTCPGQTITPYIAKTFVAYLAMKFDFELIARPNETSITKAKIKFTTRLYDAAEKMDEVAGMRL